MLLILRILILLLLAAVYLQDMRYRGVSWFIFPLLSASVVCIRYFFGQTLAVIAQSALINIGMLIMILALLTLYFMVKQRRLINITDQYLGSGDILFFAALAVYLSVLNFLLFFITSLLFVGMSHVFFRNHDRSRHIPLAGLQALLLILFLVSDWWFFHQDITDDNWLLRLYSPWIIN